MYTDYTMFTSPLAGVQSILKLQSSRLYVCMHICLSIICQFAYLKPHFQTSWNFLNVLPVALAQSCCDIAMHHVLLVLWITSRFHIMEPVAQNQSDEVIIVRVCQVAAAVSGCAECTWDEVCYPQGSYGSWKVLNLEFLKCRTWKVLKLDRTVVLKKPRKSAQFD